MSVRFNETDRLNERYVKLRPTELQRIAGEVVQQDYCPDIAKIIEGGFNKVFLLRVKNGREVITQIPTPTAGPPHYTTASEVATIDFLRAVLTARTRGLGIFNSLDNPVGAEYILIERVEGESLSSRWLSLTTDEVKDIMTQIADIERKIFDFHFPTYRTLYHEKYLNGKPIYQSWKTSISVLCLPGSCSVTNGAKKKLTHTSLLSRFLQLAPHLIRAGSYRAPTLRHPNLSLSNILLAPRSTQNH
ncbi:unnamed protein product [Penicillium egyptiacum]|uniref:Altered inheritance of mitochondria protein 9, mitochondrial n=1 Tax=Penicillium egyptiacum TaxID=1303716 RepID=A0A9W4K1F3_9EURO|nr:unnamed protein product [Penicillium egyptiacum]